MTAIDPAKAVDAFTLLENVIRGVDPEFKPLPLPPGLNATLGGLVASRSHKVKATALGQDVDSLLALGRRQILEFATTIKLIAATMPAGDANSAAITSIISQLS
jgi:hypothetical protein